MNLPTPHFVPPAENASALTQQFLAHLEEEEAFLRGARACLGEVRQALRHGDRGVLATALERQAALAQRGEELRVRRERLRSAWATQHGLAPEAVTLRLLAERASDPVRPRLAATRERLRGLTAEVHQLNRGNLKLAGHCQQFLQQLLQEFTGGPCSSPRYGPTGVAHEAVCGSLLEVRG